ncbi:MAG: serine/threonine protein kinase [Gammaproteobacteria bacterium]|jgi:Ser/Thr protein kinase RdoA (MazF antagonist)|nr:serine/threonine protein kinase [Gammaproteobacteria bacterium]
MSNDEEFLVYKNLGPDAILDAVESAGFKCDGHVSALNSYENRVYQIGLEDGSFIVAKFYRPGRWSDDSIIEEHAFTAELEEFEIPVVAPLINDGGKSLIHFDSYRFSLFPRVGGRTPELDNPDHLLQLGHCLARLHNIGAVKPFQHRPVININAYCNEQRHYILENDFIPADLLPAYESLTTDIIGQIERAFEKAGDLNFIRLHGDCHLGNILWRDDSPCLVDFDDTRMGPAIQDLWMFLSGDRAYMTSGLYDLMEGYSEFRDFDRRELQLIEPLRTMRIMHHAGWIAQRWADPAFPLAFPWFNTQKYWEEHILSLREQAAMLNEPSLEWLG